MVITLEFFRSVLKTKPLSYYIHILRLISSLSPHERYANKVFDLSRYKTGFKNKKDIMDTIGFLKESGIITLSKVNKQKKMIDFLPLGKEIIKLIDDIGNHKKAYSQLKKDIQEHFDIPQRNVTKLSASQRRHVLQQRGWKSDDAEIS
jgi:hypothetical protein